MENGCEDKEVNPFKQIKQRRNKFALLGMILGFLIWAFIVFMSGENMFVRSIIF